MNKAPDKSSNPWVRFLITRYFWTNLALFIMVLILAGWLFNFWLSGYTRHGEGAALPDLRGMPLSKAIEVIEKEGLRHQIAIKVFSEEFPKNSVTDQNPHSGEKVKKDRIIYLTVNTLAAPETEVSFNGSSSYREYSAYLNNLGLKVGNITKKVDEFPGRVLKASIEGKILNQTPVSVIKGTPVDLEITISEEEAKNEENVPMIESKALLKLSLAEARQYLQERGLTIGKIHLKTTATDSTDATIYKVKLSSKPGKLVPRGSSVDVYLR